MSVKIIEVESLGSKTMTFRELKDDAFFLNKNDELCQKNSTGDKDGPNSVYWGRKGELYFNTLGPNDPVTPVNVEIRWSRK